MRWRRVLVLLCGLSSGCQNTIPAARVLTPGQLAAELPTSAPAAVVAFVGSDPAEATRGWQALAAVRQRSGEGRKTLLVNADQSPEVRAAWNVRKTPVLLAISGGKEIDRYAGDLQAASVGAWIEVLERRELAAALAAVQVPEVHLTDADFDARIANESVPLLIDFWAPWCGPCQMIAPQLRLLAGEFAGRLTVAKVNVDVERQVARRFVDVGIPLLVLMHNGQEVDRLPGAPPPEALRDWVRAHVERIENGANGSDRTSEHAAATTAAP